MHVHQGGRQKKKTLREAENNARPWHLFFPPLFSIKEEYVHVNMGIPHETLTLHSSPNDEKLDSLTRVYEPHSKESQDFALSG